MTVENPKRQALYWTCKLAYMYIQFNNHMAYAHIIAIVKMCKLDVLSMRPYFIFQVSHS